VDGPRDVAPARSAAARADEASALIARVVRGRGPDDVASFAARYPYYAAVIARLAVVGDPSVERMAVSLHRGHFYLHVNVAAAAREPGCVPGLLLHEVHHLVLGHLAHPRFAEPAHPELMALAMEMSANEHVAEPLPSPVLWQHFERHGLRAGQSTLERYERLVAARAAGHTPAPRPGTRPVDRHDWLDRPAPRGAVAQVRALVLDAAAEVDARPPAHAAERGRAARPTLAGREPRRLVEELTGVAESAAMPFDWRGALASFVTARRAPTPTWSRPSRRFPTRVGQVPGRSWQPRTSERPSLLVAIDTSLSMTTGELEEVARQLRALGERARLVVAECDARVARVYPFEGTLPEVRGRGGTDLRPVFAPALLRAYGAEGVVYFTDGAGPFPATPPPVPVLWVLTKAGDFACPWGQRAALRGA
jgi:predicted metal-dependent peptidase